MEFMGAVEMFD